MLKSIQFISRYRAVKRVFSSQQETTAQNFFRFAEGCNFITDRSVEVAPETASMGFGLRAICDVKRGDTLLSVQQPLWHAYSSASSFEYVQKNSSNMIPILQNVITKVSPDKKMQEELEQVICLSLRLMHGMDSGSDEYLNYILRSIANSTPHALCMSDTWVALLKGTQCGRGIGIRRQMFDMLANAIFPGREMQFKQAVGVILSRGLSGNENPFSLVPYLDLANHSSTPNAEHEYNMNTQTWHLRAVTDIVKGDEVFISYGTGRNTNSFVYLYGFAPPDNINDAVTVQVPFSTGDTWRAKYIQMKPNQVHGVIEIPVQIFISIQKSDWDYVGQFLCKLNHNMLSPREAEVDGFLNGLGDMLKSVLMITKVCMSKSEEELQVMLKSGTLFDEREAIMYLLDSIKDRIAALKSNEADVTTSPVAEMKDPSFQDWHKICKLVRDRELNTFSNFFRCCIAYIDEFEKMKSSKN